MAEWKTASQTEFPPALAKRLNTFFDRLDECYPDRVVIHFNRDHKKLAERGTELRRLAGYGDDNEKFFSDFGFTYVNALKQKTDSHGTYEDLIARLKAAFPDGIVCLYQAAAFRDDLSYFARKKMRTAKQILKNAGVLRDRRPDEVIRPEDDTDDFDAPAKAPAAEKAPAKTPVPVEEPVATEEPTVETVVEEAAETPAEEVTEEVTVEAAPAEPVAEEAPAEEVVEEAPAAEESVAEEEAEAVEATPAPKTDAPLVRDDGTIPTLDEESDEATPYAESSIYGDDLRYAHVGDFEFELTKDGKGYSLTYYMGASRTVTVPSVCNGLPVTEIGPSAFRSINNVAVLQIERLVLPKQLKAIRCVFRDSPRIRKVVFPDTLEYVEPDAFIYTDWGMDDGKEMTVEGAGLLLRVHPHPDDNGVLRVPDGVRNVCCSFPADEMERVKTVILPDSVELIGMNAFRGCDRIEMIRMGNRVTSIGAGAFYGDLSLSTISLPNSLRSIGDFAFYNCRSLPDLLIPDSVETVGQNLFVTMRRDFMISIPEHLAAAFVDCKYATHVRQPGEEGDLFASCRLRFDYLTDEDAYRLGACILDAPTVKIPAEYRGKPVVAVGTNAFRGLSQLTTVVLPDTVTRLHSCAFHDCPKLSALEMPGVERIDSFAFDHLDALETLTVPVTCVSVGYGGIVRGCDNLRRIFLHEGRSALKKTLESRLLGSEIELVTIPREPGTNEVYRLLRDGSGYEVLLGFPVGDSISVPASYRGKPVKRVGPYAYADGYSVADIILPEMLEEIGDSAFRYVTGPISVTIPDSVRVIEGYAFAAGTLAEVKFGSGLTSIGEHAFDRCRLVSLILPAGVTEVAPTAFDDNRHLSVVLAPTALVPTIRPSRFEKTAKGFEAVPMSVRVFSVTEITEDKKEEELKNAHFEMVENSDGRSFTVRAFIRGALTDVEVPAEFRDLPVSAIGERAFYDCRGLKSVVLPDTVQVIGDEAFSRCIDLNVLTLGNGVVRIGKSAFYRTAIETLTIPDTIEEIGKFAVLSCTALKTVYVPSHVATAFSHTDLDVVTHDVLNRAKFDRERLDAIRATAERGQGSAPDASENAGDDAARIADYEIERRDKEDAERRRDIEREALLRELQNQNETLRNNSGLRLVVSSKARALRHAARDRIAEIERALKEM